MKITISGNSNLLSVLNKNPNSLGGTGLYPQKHRNGTLIGNCINDSQFEVIFLDTKHSYTRYEDNQLDFKSFCASNLFFIFFFFFKQKTAYEIVSRDWSSDVCSSDLVPMVFCLGTEGSKSSLLRNGWLQCFSYKELKVPMDPYL